MMKTSCHIAAAIALVCLLARSAGAQFVQVSTPTDPDRIIMTYDPAEGHVEVNSPHEIRIFMFTSNSGVFEPSGLTHPDEFQGWFDAVNSWKIFKTINERVGFGTYMDIGNVVPNDMDYDEFASEFSLTVRVVGFDSFEQLSDPPGFGLYVQPASSIPGDYDGNGSLEAADLDMQAAAIASQDLSFDENGDGEVGDTDRHIWVHDFRKTWIGDANLDGEFDSSDMVQVFASGKYETEANAGWIEGDWDGNGVFDSSDMVAAFADSGYENGPRTAVAVPEPTSALLLMAGLIGFAIVQRRQRS